MRIGDKLGFILMAIMSILALLGGLSGEETRRGPGVNTGVGQSDRVRRPPVIQPGQPGLRSKGPLVFVENDVKHANSVGTAFPIDDRGHFLTARHVIDGCRAVGLFIGNRKLKGAEVVVAHRSADVALIRSRQSRAQTPFPLTDMFRPVRTAYSVGYPSGEPGAVKLRYLGNVTLGHRGRSSGREPAVAWAVTQRLPKRLSAFGGISGGPLFDAQGAIIGISVAGNDRRGRLITSRPASFYPLLQKIGVQPSGRDAPNFGARGLKAVADDLISTRRVPQVYCKVRR